MRNFGKKAAVVAAATAGLAMLGASGSAFAATMPEASTATHTAPRDVPVTFGGAPDAGTTNGNDVIPSYEQSVKRFNRAGAAAGYGAATLVSSAVSGVPVGLVSLGKDAMGGNVTQVTDHHRG